MRSSRQPASGWLRKRRPVSFDLGKGTLAQISKKVDARIRLSWRNGVTRRAKAAGFLTPAGCDTWRATGITIYLENGRLERAHGAYRPRLRFNYFKYTQNYIQFLFNGQLVTFGGVHCDGAEWTSPQFNPC